MEERIRKQIDEYTRQRDNLVQQANQQIAALNGAIAALEALLEPNPTVEADAGEDQP